ncbi:MAG TPA: hypothetical protein VMV53_03190 [Acidimicrobiales bacterium]|nr:hypothetical protein [Acidimicrobiales bacterium]
MTSADQPNSGERDVAAGAHDQRRASWKRPWRWVTDFLFEKPPGFYAPVIPKGDGAGSSTSEGTPPN